MQLINLVRGNGRGWTSRKRKKTGKCTRTTTDDDGRYVYGSQPYHDFHRIRVFLSRVCHDDVFPGCARWEPVLTRRCDWCMVSANFAGRYT